MRRTLDKLHDPTVKAVLDRLVSDLHDRHEATYDMMRRLDRNGDGRLDREELRGGLRGLGVLLSESEMDSVLRTFDTNRSGRIDYQVSLLGPTLLCATLLRPTLLRPTLPRPTLLGPTLLCATLLRPTLLRPTLPRPTLLCPTLLCATLLRPTLLRPTLPRPTLLCPTLLCPALLRPALLWGHKLRRADRVPGLGTSNTLRPVCGRAYGRVLPRA